MNAEKITKIAKWVAYALEIAFVVVFIILCVTVGQKNKRIKNDRYIMADQTEMIDSLKARCDELGSVDCIRVETSCIINNKGLVNVSQTNQISKTIATYTRNEVLAALDSLNRINNQE